MERKKARRPLVAPEYAPKPESLIQILPEQRARIDPSAITDIYIWLLCVRYRYYLRAGQTMRGKRGHAKLSAMGDVRFARSMMRAIDQIAESLTQTVDARMVDAARRGLGLPPL